MTKITFVNGTTPAINDTNLNQMQTNIENAINQVAQRGSNSNGSYIKFSDGTLICYGTKSGTSSLTDYWGTAERTNTITVTFPQAFIEAPTVNMGISLSNTQFAGGVMSKSTSNFTCLVLKPKGVTDTNYTFDYMAIGKWK